MRLDLDTEPTVEPLALQDVRNHRRVTGSDDDDLLTELIAAARQEFEEETGRQVITATWKLYLDRFPHGREPIVVPKAPLQTVASITYVDTAGATQTWSSDEYQVDAFSGPFARQGRIYPKPVESYPGTYAVPDAVQVTFDAGYDDAAAGVPKIVRAAIYSLIGGHYEEREDIIVGTVVTRNPSLERVLDRLRLPAYA